MRSRSVVPPNGWIVRIRKLNSEARFWDFGSAVQWYIQFASANPSVGLSTDQGVVERIIDLQNAARVSKIPNTGEYVMLMDNENEIPAEALASCAPSIKSCCGLKRK